MMSSPTASFLLGAYGACGVYECPQMLNWTITNSLKMRVRKLPPIEVLREVLTYCPESGELKWRVKPSQRENPGEIAGAIDSRGYLYVSVNKERYLGHRIVWALHYGEDTELYIDHKDGDKSNNRIANLRLVRWGENVQNVPRRSNNTSGHRGVNYNKRKGKWQAQIDVNGKRLYLGTYDCVEDAINARLKAEADNNIYVRAR